MAYKFQVGDAVLIGNTTFQNQLTASIMSGTTAHFQELSCSADSLTIGTTTISEVGPGQLNIPAQITASMLSANGIYGDMRASGSAGYNFRGGIVFGDDDVGLGGDRRVALFRKKHAGKERFFMNNNQGPLQLSGSAEGAPEAEGIILASGMSTWYSISSSAGISASSFVGDGSGITGITSTSATVNTTANFSAGNYYIPFFDSSGTETAATVYINDTLNIIPSSSVMTISNTNPTISGSLASGSVSRLVLSSSNGMTVEALTSEGDMQARAFGRIDFRTTDSDTDSLGVGIWGGAIDFPAGFGGGSHPWLALEARDITPGTNSGGVVYLSGSHTSLGVYVDSSFTVEEERGIQLGGTLLISPTGETNLGVSGELISVYAAMQSEENISSSANIYAHQEITADGGAIYTTNDGSGGFVCEQISLPTGGNWNPDGSMVVDNSINCSAGGGLAGIFSGGKLEASGSVVLGDASGDVLTVNATTHFSASIKSPQNAIAWEIQDGISGEGSDNGALLFYGPAGTDYLKFNTSGSFKGVSFPRTFFPSTNDSVDMGTNSLAFRTVFASQIGSAGDIIIDGVNAGDGGVAINMPNDVNEGFMIRDTTWGDNFMTFVTTTDYETVRFDKIGLRYGGLAVLSGSDIDLETAVSAPGKDWNNQDRFTYVVCYNTAALDMNVYLPDTPTRGDWLSIKRHSGMGNDVIIYSGSLGAGRQIDGDNSVTLESAGAAVTLVYDDETANWNIF